MTTCCSRNCFVAHTITVKELHYYLSVTKNINYMIVELLLPGE